ncbi:formate dehydrogenase subunit delta [Pseudomonas sp. BGr12]|uniref:formate dehydrogenase subunit delta n=1 Tax=unclassified Pseudomonas TaxID=196821 RepID=UPI001782DAC7|nr:MULTISPECIES: formate dehydrogenase subunit delta [unclassified Pseudomonas]MBD9505047.1 formate dehydrogenase subunit delta [Pseudomonas sp. PDM17]MBD9578398.1 formate dehydrogenase subunit delta [Pseudomonas sp. PDM23]MBD9631615.1 formate dehydrogenase subunit delta [Pseudomonas sp. PDM19]MBD9673597.1 formate dehydrogenase subunit delta [Pseudomonas sp. PDM21]MDL2431378.1 formate dehydrogenase subunit delta [Pseudomonas sp. BJa5]
MSVENLIKMANQIGQYFSTESDHALAVHGVQQHLQNFWTPAMRRDLKDWHVNHPGTELHALVQAALTETAQA